MQERSGLLYAVFANWYSKKPPSPLSIVYSVPVDLVPERIRQSIRKRYPAERWWAQGCFTLARMHEGEFYSGGERCSVREEHEQFNRKIASPPRRWGICILAHY